MENRVQAHDKAILNHNFMLMYSQLSDLSTFPKWFKTAKMTFNKENDTLTVKPFGAGEFTWSIVETVENKRITMEYKGTFEGKGHWILEPHGAATRLIYEVNLEINNPFLCFVNKFISIENQHSKMMEKVFKSLDTYVSNLHRKS